MSRPMPQQVFSAVSDANGNATAAYVPQFPCTIQQISISTSGTSLLGNAKVFVNGQFICGSGQAFADAAAGEPYIPIQLGDQLKVIFAMVGVGVTCTVTLQGVQA